MNPAPPWWDVALIDGSSVTPARLALGAILFVLGWLASRWVGGVLARRASHGRLDPGARYAIGRLLNYAFVLISVFV